MAASGEDARTWYDLTLSERKEHPSLSGTHDADVCVIGGGLAGLNVAFSLVERGKRTILIESRTLGGRASGRNAGLVVKGYAAENEELAGKAGLESARKLLRLSKNAQGLIRRRIAGYKIDCGPIVDGMLMASRRNNAQKLRESVSRANDDFDAALEFWPQEKVRELCKTPRYYDGIFSPGDFQIHPLKYLQGLARVIAEKGGLIFEQSPALKIERHGMGWRVKTPQGEINAQHVVLCCSAYVDRLDCRLDCAIVPVQTYMMVTQPVARDVLRNSINTNHFLLDTRFITDYYRVLPDDRIMWGGRVGLWAQPRDIAALMMGDMLKIYPQLEGHVKPDMAWSGVMSFAPHRMPQIGQREPGYWYCTAFGGHGLCPTTMGGEIIAAAIAQEDETYKEFARFGLGFSGGRMSRYAAQMVYLGWRTRDALGL